jgi:hypothetical protein
MADLHVAGNGQFGHCDGCGSQLTEEDVEQIRDRATEDVIDTLVAVSTDLADSVKEQHIPPLSLLLAMATALTGCAATLHEVEMLGEVDV